MDPFIPGIDDDELLFEAQMEANAVPMFQYGVGTPSAWTEVAGDGAGIVLGKAASATRKVIQQAAAVRPPPAVPDVLPPDVEEVPEPVDTAFDALLYGVGGAWSEIVGAETVEYRFPRLRRIYERFSKSAPRPKLVRVDTEDSYKDFVTKKAFAELAGRLSRLESAFGEHLSDGHGPQVEPWDIVGAIKATEIPLSLPPYCEGNVRCWQDSGAICCSIRLPGPDGKARFATAATPVARHVDEVLGYVRDAGLDGEEVVGILPALPILGLMLGGGSLVPQLASAAPALLSCPESATGEPYLRKVVPANETSLATVMALAQLVQSGDPQARAEWASLSAVAGRPGGEPLAAVMANGVRRLATAQRKRN